MSNGLLRVKEEYLDEAKKEAEELIRGNYTFFKNKITGYATSSSIGIEKYKIILTEEVKCVLAIERSISDLDKGMIDEERDIDYNVKHLLTKFDEAITEGENIEKINKKKDEEYGLKLSYSMLAGFGSAYILLQEEIENPKYSVIFQKCRESIGKITISLPDSLKKLLNNDQSYIEKIIDYLEDRSVIKTKEDKDFALLYGKFLITKLRYELQQENLKKNNFDTKLYKQLSKLRLQMDGIAVSEMVVEDIKNNRKVGDATQGSDVIAEIEKVDWTEVIGQNEAKKLLKDSVVRFLGTYDSSSKQSIFETILGTKPPKAVLLYGPPGTGKTFMLKAVITEAEKIRENLIKEGKIQSGNKRIKFIIITPDQIKDKYVGESAKAIKNVFTQARKEAPALLVIDELDAFFSRRSESGFNEGEREIVSILMQELEGLKDSTGYVLVGITNMPKLVDKAILSRFDRKIEFYIPKDSKEVTDLFRVYLKNLIKNGCIPKITEEDWKKLGEVGHSLGFTGRTIKQFVKVLEQERNDILTEMYGDNTKVVEEYHKSPNKMKEKLNEKTKKFTIGYMCEQMGKFASHAQHAESYSI